MENEDVMRIFYGETPKPKKTREELLREIRIATNKLMELKEEDTIVVDEKKTVWVLFYKTRKQICFAGVYDDPQKCFDKLGFECPINPVAADIDIDFYLLEAVINEDL